MKTILLLSLLTAFVINVFAQKENFDVLSYKPISGWKKESNEKYISFTKNDEAKGTFCIISFYRSADGGADSKNNFDNCWQKMIQEPLGAGSPKMETPNTENGWELQTGSAQFNKDGLAGIAILTTASNNGKMVNMLVLFNSDAYMTQLNDLIGSVELKKQATVDSHNGAPTPGSNNASVVGIWTYNLLETSGYFNGYPQYTAGYFRKEYTFKSDGTYFFSRKDWSAYSKVILYACESGTWSTNGNTLTLSPTKGKAGEWNRTSNNREWGSLIKTLNWPLAKTAYTYEIIYYSGSKNTVLLLNCGKTTERDGTYTNQSFNYTLHDQQIIDLPPGF